MDISKIICVDPNQDFKGALKEKMRESPSNVTLPFLLRNIDNKTDALEAVKCDPAVLKAQITVGQETAPEPDHHGQPDTIIYQEKEVEVPTLIQPSFEELMCGHQAALKSLTPEQFLILMKFADFLRKKRFGVQKYTECAFCKNNGEPKSWYSSHALKDWRGRVLCPVLRAFRCPRCGATGDRAHTIKYCPENYDADLWSI